MKELYGNVKSITVKEITEAYRCDGYNLDSTEILSLVNIVNKDGSISTYYGVRRIYDDRIYLVSSKEVAQDFNLPCGRY